MRKALVFLLFSMLLSIQISAHTFTLEQLNLHKAEQDSPYTVIVFK